MALAPRSTDAPVCQSFFHDVDIAPTRRLGTTYHDLNDTFLNTTTTVTTTLHLHWERLALLPGYDKAVHTRSPFVSFLAFPFPGGLDETVIPGRRF